MYRSVQIASIAIATIAVAGCILPSSQPVARVDDRQITARELYEETLAMHGGQVLLEMIDTRLILQAGQKQKVRVEEAEVEAEMEKAITQAGDKKELERMLDQRGLSMEDFGRQCQASVILDRLARPMIPVDERTLRKYYEQHKEEFKHGPQVHARWMLFDDEDSARAVRSILDEPDASFAGLAKSLSSDSVTASDGGDMGFFGKEDYTQEITAVAFALEPNEISDVFRVPDGWAILQAIEKRPAGSPPFEDVADQLKARIRAEKMPQARQEWLKQARQKADIVIRDAELERQVQTLIETGQPYNPTRLLQIPQTPQMPMQ
ncbi:MAG: peptidylprolyl isomerase [Armatimonadota bacterium]